VDDDWLEGKGVALFGCGLGTGKGEMRGLSTAAAKCAAFGRDDASFCRWGEEQATAKANADPYGMTNKRIDNDKGFVG
jgi:hypothetical protein